MTPEQLVEKMAKVYTGNWHEHESAAKLMLRIVLSAIKEGECVQLGPNYGWGCDVVLKPDFETFLEGRKG